MGRGLGSKRRVAEGDAEPEEEEEGSSEEYEVEVVRDHIASSRGSRLALFGSDLRLGRFRPRRRRREGGAEGFFQDLVIHPDNRYANPALSSPNLRSLVALEASASSSSLAPRLLLLLEAAWRRGDAKRRARSLGCVHPIGRLAPARDFAIIEQPGRTR
jgi:hypothetical protein